MSIRPGLFTTIAGVWQFSAPPVRAYLYFDFYSCLLKLLVEGKVQVNFVPEIYNDVNFILLLSIRAAYRKL